MNVNHLFATVCDDALKVLLEFLPWIYFDGLKIGENSKIYILTLQKFAINTFEIFLFFLIFYLLT